MDVKMGAFKKTLSFVDDKRLTYACAKLQRSLLVIINDEYEEIRLEMKQLSIRVQGISNAVNSMRKTRASLIK